MSDSVQLEPANSRMRWLGCRKTIGCAVALLLGCGAEAPRGLENATEAKVESREQFVVWLSDLDPLVVEHATWHNAPCASPGARHCHPDVRGEDFLKFHRKYLRRLRNKFDELGRTEDIEPWYQLPPEMKLSMNGWTMAHAAAEQALLNNLNPSTGVPFASVNEFGDYLERNLHDSLHGIARKAYGETAIGPASISPTSTYFFKIHGYVEYLYQRFQRADMTKDGKADLLRRSPTTGENYRGAMDGTTITEWKDMVSMSDQGCRWKMGGVADFNFDGFQDLVWHGPGCSRTRVWYLGASSVRIDDAEMPPANDSWRLVGTGDFNRDLWPDLLWVRESTNQLSFEMMDNTVFLGSVTRQLPTQQQAVLLADFDDDGFLDLLLRNRTTLAYTIQYLRSGHVFASAAGRRVNVGGPSDAFTSVVGSGRYHAGAGGTNADLVWVREPCSSCNVSLLVTPWTQASGAGVSQGVGTFARTFEYTSPR